MTQATCFISYSWDSIEHRQWVLQLAVGLQNGGVHVHLDQWDVKLGMNLPQYMEQCIRESSYVLLICTPTFAQKADHVKGGVGYEKTIVTGQIFASTPRETKFVPILRAGTAAEAIPSYLKAKAYMDMRNESEFRQGLEDLLRHIHDAPAVLRPALGMKPNFLEQGNTQITSKQQPPQRRLGGSFDIGRYQQIVDYAKSYNGLKMPLGEATQWANKHSNDDPAFDIERYKRIVDYAKSYNGLKMSLGDAIQWTDSHINDDPAFDIERYQRIVDYAKSYNGLKMSLGDAIRWADSHINDTPAFDIEAYRRLVDYAKSYEGLRMSLGDAIQWAETKLAS